MRLIGKDFLFKIKISIYNLENNLDVFTVSKMSNNEKEMRDFIGENKVY